MEKNPVKRHTLGPMLVSVTSIPAFLSFRQLNLCCGFYHSALLPQIYCLFCFLTSSFGGTRV
jgi:hypothetical protein